MECNVDPGWKILPVTQGCCSHFPVKETHLTLSVQVSTEQKKNSFVPCLLSACCCEVNIAEPQIILYTRSRFPFSIRGGKGQRGHSNSQKCHTSEGGVRQSNHLTSALTTTEIPRNLTRHQSGRQVNKLHLCSKLYFEFRD